MMNRRPLRHISNDLFAFLYALKLRAGLNGWNCWNIDSFALCDIEDAVVTKERNGLASSLPSSLNLFQNTTGNERSPFLTLPPSK